MTHSNAQFIQQNGLSIHSDFHQFVETSVIPSTALTSDQFWSALTSLVATADTYDRPFICHQSTQSADLRIDVRSCIQPVNTSWGSLYDALYNDGIIPHTAGLKPGCNTPGGHTNVARRKRVISCAKDFLDQTFPLSEGSHRDAISYLVYFQNLLIILADGSTTGLQHPKQFVGKNGPADAPESILLQHNGTHTEVFFNANGATGCIDLAAVDDIHLESTGQTLFDFNANTALEKCSTYKNWLNIIRHQQGKTFSNRNGEHQSLRCGNHTITSSATNDQCTLIIDQDSNPVAEAIVDIITATLIEASNSSTAQLQLTFTDSPDGIDENFVLQLQKFLTTSIRTPGKTGNASQTPCVKVIAQAADTRRTSATRTNRTASGLQRASSPLNATIGTMQSHGYSVTPAAPQ